MGLDSIHKLTKILNKTGNFHLNIPNIIHVAGTNGKGSTVAFLENILKNHGFSVNAYTSPHLVSYNERFRLNGKIVTDDQLQKAVQFLQSIQGYNSLHMFEKATLQAFYLFANNKADYTILETGLGGRLDATNIITPKVCIITLIGVDHTEFLGESLKEIAYEKCGIIKPNCTVITGLQKKEVQKIIQSTCKEKYCVLLQQNKNYKIINNSYEQNDFVLDLSQISLQGTHQHYNAALAITASASLINLNLELTKTAIQNTKWEGRLQRLKALFGVNLDNTNLQIYLDGAHNEDGAFALKEFIEHLQQNNPNAEIILALGMLKTKNLKQFLSIVNKDNNLLNLKIMPLEILGEDYKFDCYSISEIATTAKELSLEVITNKTIKDIVSEANNNQSLTGNIKKRILFITGSLYLIGNFMKNTNIKVT